MKRLLSLATLLAVAATAAAFDFSAPALTGQTLYFTRTSDSTVSVVSPGWDLYAPPTGHLSLPPTVQHGAATYALTAVADGAFRLCSGLTAVVVPEGVTTIGRTAFAYCSALDSISLPSTLTFIGSQAFNSTAYWSNGANLAADNLLYVGRYVVGSRIGAVAGHVVLADSTLGVANMALYGDSNMTALTLPASLRFVGALSLAGCTRLDTLHVLAPVPPALDDDATDNEALVVAVPCGAAEAYRSAPVWGGFEVVAVCDTTGDDPGPGPNPGPDTGTVAIAQVDRAAPVVAAEGGLRVRTAEPRRCVVTDAAGRKVASAVVTGEATLALPRRGVYVVTLEGYPPAKVVCLK